MLYHILKGPRRKKEKQKLRGKTKKLIEEIKRKFPSIQKHQTGIQ